MADSKSSSKYVKLKETSDGSHRGAIKPGELNQPIEVPQLKVHKCNECDQPLPADYAPPADEQWTTEIFGCAEDPESCWTGLFCPCVLFGLNYETLGGHRPWTGLCICHAIFVEGGVALAAAMAMFHGIDHGISYKLECSDNFCRKSIISRTHLVIHAWCTAACLLALVCLVPRTQRDEGTSSIR